MSVKIFLVKPHPPAEILARNCPIPEGYRYNWEPVSLKVLAHGLLKESEVRIDLSLWHLMDENDDRLFDLALERQRPDIVVFSEIDVLVNEVSRWALRVKELLPDTWTVVGGKQTSLLQKEDRFPFKGIDYAIRGDGSTALSVLVDHRKRGQCPVFFQGLVCLDGSGHVAEPVSYGPRSDLENVRAEVLRSFEIQNHSIRNYVTHHQHFPSLQGETRTASILSATGCPFRCSFCQSPVEYGSQSRTLQQRPVDEVVKEVLWFIRETDANHFFFLEPNLNLRNLVHVYNALAENGIPSLSIAGFVRAGDVVSAYRAGYLPFLASKGLRVLSIGLDVPPDSGTDIHNKSFSYEEMLSCLDICKQLGILVLGTFFGNPDVTVGEYERQLSLLAELPVTTCEVRLAMALRNTDYFRNNERFLLHHPDQDQRYFDWQNYRYQTLQFPGKIVPEQTYAATNRFYDRYLSNAAHLSYVAEMIERHPDTRTFFRNQYRSLRNRENSTIERIVN